VNRELAEAYARCERLAQSHYENFPVASRLLPAPMRPHIAAIYAFARLADDMADEGERPAAARIADLDAWEARLAAAVRGEAAGSGPDAGIFLALRHTIEVCGLPPTLLHDLISAFRQDVSVKRYAAWEDLLDYCRRSANPVGRLVLREGADMRALPGDEALALPRMSPYDAFALFLQAPRAPRGKERSTTATCRQARVRSSTRCLSGC